MKDDRDDRRAVTPKIMTTAAARVWSRGEAGAGICDTDSAGIDRDGEPTIRRTSWHDLPAQLHTAVRDRTGTIESARDAAAGRNSAIAAILRTASGSLFVKGIAKDHPGVVCQDREVAVNPYVQPIGATLRWQADIDRWKLLAFDYLPGRHADLNPGSPDIPATVATMHRLATLRCPALSEVKRAEQRWREYVDSPTEVDLLAGPVLLHTDYSPDNILVTAGRARLVDWAWPTLGAGFIDPASLVVRLIATGHTPNDAERQVARLATWRAAPQAGIDTISSVLARMWTDIADADPKPWKRGMAKAARAWADRRRGTPARR
jgi:hypothetical protein